MIAIRMRAEGLIHPIGIDTECPTLSWNCQGGQQQTAYQICAEEDTGNLLWDSGKVKSDAMRNRWGGAPVPPKTKVLWKVRLWNENDTAGDWSEACFETGIGTWSAKWITGDYPVNKKERYPVDCFRKVFHAADVKKARLYITACGLYEANLNGQRVGNFVRAPGITDYRKRVQYQTYDVTALLQDGENALTVQLADGWYRGSCGAWGLKNQYGTERSCWRSWSLPAPTAACRLSPPTKAGSGPTTAPFALPTTRMARWSTPTIPPRIRERQRSQAILSRRQPRIMFPSRSMSG